MENDLVQLTHDLVDNSVPDIKEGFPFRGAAVPFGMVMFGPNGKDTARGYSLFTLQGAETSEQFIGFLPFRPTTLGAVEARTLGPVPNQNRVGIPGYFEDQMEEGIDVKLTATARTGFAVFSFPDYGDRRVVFGATFSKVGDQRHSLSGYSDVQPGYRVYFHAEFDHPIVDSDVHQVCFERTIPDLTMKVGLSYVSLEKAQSNLITENPGWEFESIKTAAFEEWNRILGHFEIGGGSKDDLGLFATCVYRTFLQPNTFSDCDGEFLGFDGQVHRSEDAPVYSSYSLWDTYRTWIQLVAAIEPKTASDLVQTLVLASENGRKAMPRWSIANVETGIMEEGCATPFVTSAYAFGAVAFDLNSAWMSMNRAESDPDAVCQSTEAHPSFERFLQFGFVPHGDDYNRRRAASFTLEYGMAAFALSEFARATERHADAERLLRQSQAWKFIFNKDTGYIQSKTEGGSWFPTEFDPADGHFKGFTEGNSAQFTWTVRHNMASVIERMGGRNRAAKRLDTFFEELNAGKDRPHCWIGNEPCLTTPWAYHWCGAPHQTQVIVDRILEEVWKPGSLPGADDLGTLSSWFIWASLGLFPAIPGTNVLLLTAPRFEKAVIHLPNNRQLTIVAPGRAEGRRFVSSVRWNGSKISPTWLRWSLLKEGGFLEFELTMESDKRWRSSIQDEPPSFD